MKARCMFRAVAVGVLLYVSFFTALSTGGETVNTVELALWRQRAVDHLKNRQVISVVAPE